MRTIFALSQIRPFRLNCFNAGTVLPVLCVLFLPSMVLSQSSFQIIDTYNNDSTGVTQTSPVNVITGFDNTAYTVSGTEDQWTVQNNPAVGAPSNGNYIDVEANASSSTDTGGYETLLRNSPYVGTCGGGPWIVQGDVDMPSTLQNGGVLGSGGQNATLVIMENPANNYGFNVILNHDYPGVNELQLQEYNVGAGTGPGSENYTPVAFLTSGVFQSAAMNADSPSGIMNYNTWYTIQAQMTLNPNSTFTINVRAWPVGTLQPAGWDITYTTGVNGSASYLPCGNYEFGWEADPSSVSVGNYSAGHEFYTDLSLVAPVPTPTVVPTSTPPAPDGNPYVYSNPSSGPTVHFVYQMASAGQARITVLNDVGNVVAQINDTKSAGVQESSLNIKPFAPGHYFYQVNLQYTTGGADRFAPKILAITK